MGPELPQLSCRNVRILSVFVEIKREIVRQVLLHQSMQTVLCKYQIRSSLWEFSKQYFVPCGICESKLMCFLHLCSRWLFVTK